MGDTFSDSYTCWNCLLKRLLHFAFTIWRAVPIWLASSGASIATFSSELLPTSTLFSPWPELGPTLHLQLPAHHLQPHSRLRAPAALSEPTMASTTKPPHFSPSLTNDNMNTKRRIMSSPSLRLLDLPRELRDMVYGFTLVRDHIEVASPKRRVADPNLAVFLTNRQVYQEATEVFYSRNNFRFTSSGLTKIPSVATCLAFLKDRSGTKYIKSLTLALEPYSNVMFGTLNSAVIQNDSTIIGLINCINTSLPQLEHLGLTFNGRPLDVRQLPWEINGDSYSVSQMPLLWIKHLFTLRKLKSLYIRHRCDEKFGDPACLVAFVSLLRAHLLVNGEHLGTQNIRKHNRHCAYLVTMASGPARVPESTRLSATTMKRASRCWNRWLANIHCAREHLQKIFMTLPHWSKPKPSAESDVCLKNFLQRMTPVGYSLSSMSAMALDLSISMEISTSSLKSRTGSLTMPRQFAVTGTRTA